MGNTRQVATRPSSGCAFQTLVGRKLKALPGSSIALDWAILAVRKAGTVSIVGVYGPANLVPIGVAVNKELTFRMAQALHAAAPRARARGTARRPGLVTHRFPLERAARAYELVDAKEDGSVKAVLLPQA